MQENQPIEQQNLPDNKNFFSKKRLLVLSLFAVIVLLAFSFFKFTNLGKELISLWDAKKSLFPLITISSLIDSINPCAFSVLLITIAFLFSSGKTRKDIFKTGFSYIFGIFLIYILIGLGILQVLILFGTPHVMAKVGASIVILFGLLDIIDEFYPKFPIKLKIPKMAHLKIAKLMQKGSLIAAFLLGVVVGLFEFPCTGGPYLTVLGLLHDHATFWPGFFYLIYYNVIFILPLVIVLFIGSDKNVLHKLEELKSTKTRQMRFFSGLAMILLGVIIFLL
ncbi:MAG: cytochrome c biogenesis protein CcdA [Candidatus Paceibacterota bacterium]|jgi:cytochrome c biogenesis protein CcdA